MKKLILFITLILCVVMLTSCVDLSSESLRSAILEAAGYEDAPDIAQETQDNSYKQEETVAYYNKLYGLEVKALKDWWVFSISDDNLSTSKDAITKPSHMSKDADYDYEYYYSYSLFHMANYKSYTDPRHVLFTASIYHDEDYTNIDDYCVYLVDAYEEDNEAEYYYNYSHDENVRINGLNYTMMEFEVYDYGDKYIERVYASQLNKYDYLVIIVNLWPDNEVSVEDAENIIKDAVFYDSNDVA